RIDAIFLDGHAAAIIVDCTFVTREKGVAMPLSAHADSLFDTLIYRSHSRSHHAVPAPGENCRRDRVVGATGEDDAEVAGGTADHAGGPRATHAPLPEREQAPRCDATDYLRIYGSTSERALCFTGVKYGRSPMIAIKAHPLKPAMVVYVQPENIDELAMKLADLEGILLARTELDQAELISRLERIA